MSGRFHIYIIKTSKGLKHIESRSLCPHCAAQPAWRVEELYERNGGCICSGCGVSPQEYEASHLPATIPTGGGCIIRA